MQLSLVPNASLTERFFERYSERFECISEISIYPFSLFIQSLFSESISNMPLVCWIYLPPTMITACSCQYMRYYPVIGY